MKNKYLIGLLLLLTGYAHGQDSELNLVTAQQVADHLRSEYPMAKAVYLTQMASQLSNSFASTEQLQQQWQQALAHPVVEPNQFTQINSHALMAQSLIQYTNGMNLNRWRQVSLPWQPTLPATTDQPLAAQTFNTWANLSYFWRQLMTDSGRSNMSLWLDWLDGEASAQPPVAVKAPALLPILRKLSANNQLPTPWPDRGIEFLDELTIALLRQAKHHQDQQLLPLAYDWIEIYQLLELNDHLLTADEQQHLSQLIQLVSAYWLENESAVNQIDSQLHQLLTDLLLELPLKFKNPDHINIDLNQQIFKQLTGISSPSAYFNHPLRQSIQENLEVCLNLSVRQPPEPPEPIDSNQFISCLNDFVLWGTVTAQSAELASNLIRLDNVGSINRALDLPSFQIINNLTMQAAGEVECQQQLTPHSNAVEWLLAAETVSWFHDRWPALMADPTHQSLLQSLLNQGQQLHRYPDCLNQAKPLNQQLQLLTTKWEKLKAEINNQVKAYTQTELTAGNDIDLFKSTDQQTQYIPSDMMIKACDVTTACGAFESFTPSAELLSLFPNHLRLAEQFGLGELSICYDQVQWVNRKTAPTHLDNNKIANFSGQLSVKLIGRYQEQTVFTQNLISDQQHVYLFGENNQETLDMSCPLPIIGKQINTTLDRGTFGLLPNRLTFLTAQKTDINAVLRNNWSRWQSKVINQPEENFTAFNDMNEVNNALNDAFLLHVNAIQQQIYRKLIANNLSRSNDSALSKAVFEFLTHRRLLSHMTTGMYPQLYAEQSNIRSALAGKNRLVDMQFFRQAYQSQMNVMDMMVLGDENLASHSFDWHETNQSGLLTYKVINQLSNSINNQ